MRGVRIGEWEADLPIGAPTCRVEVILPPDTAVPHPDGASVLRRVDARHGTERAERRPAPALEGTVEVVRGTDVELLHRLGNHQDDGHYAAGLPLPVIVPGTVGRSRIRV